MVLSLRSNDLTYKPSFSTIKCDKAECSPLGTHVFDFFFFFYFSLGGWGFMHWLSFVSGQGMRVL